MSLLEFYGAGCPHCENMKTHVGRLKEEEGIEISALEVWENEENGKKLAEIDRGLCGGVPLFYNTETKSFLCGEVSYEDLKAWAKGK